MLVDAHSLSLLEHGQNVFVVFVDLRTLVVKRLWYLKINVKLVREVEKKASVR